ncbi:MAG: bifunctional adenosylcobinamide kinase/adenosylcobinamide-phosphate guanylyltransferase [Roseitalea sp.]|jgi:adenosylcobinamide kinase/adenosylcobinamide-phosphate guanylyltransferase|nr:bifunctional adenosylcobinamide kinase/adenosylcobinamide-phosphate guanylyltransferase [Roseitalea sp.]MBO6721292.1 bifunctional adenosylcobinamide kinase/adenosylcobinamide-phosphate guanylyltransferase [Roseitalea sp.]MBO6742223.1 bifunctional adenosylcobinamide kinase/adenosylcobinamide-phosphate guanylyltransferase [Roseitalea sp.]
MGEPVLKKGVTLVLGGARSGKSMFAERLVAGTDLEPVYVATAQIFDEEMRERIAHHRARRGAEWRLVEEHDALEGVLAREAMAGRAVLVDCLTLWVSNLMLAEADIRVRSFALLDALGACKAPVVLVSNEVGLGIVPDNQMARDFRDYAGRLNQEIAAHADTVYFLAAGLPLTLKG